MQKAREQWAENLWANLNVNVLQDGIEGFLKALRKLPKEVKNLTVGKELEEKMKEFRDSLPLFVDLKHEALRDRSVVEPSSHHLFKFSQSENHIDLNLHKSNLFKSNQLCFHLHKS